MPMPMSMPEKVLLFLLDLEILLVIVGLLLNYSLEVTEILLILKLVVAVL